MDVYREALTAAREYLEACLIYGDDMTDDNEARCEAARDKTIAALEALRSEERDE